MPRSILATTLGSSLLVLTLVAAPTAAQVTIAPGTRVRVIAPGVLDRRVEGRLAPSGPDSLVVMLDSRPGGLIALGAATPRQLEIVGGRARGRGAVRGLVIGGVLGVALGAVTAGERNSDARSAADSLSYGQYLGASTIGFGGIGALIGAIIGVERWVPVAGPVRVGVRPSRRGVVVVATRR